MDAQTSRRWHDWTVTLIKCVLDEHYKAAVQGIKEALDIVRKQLRREFSVKIRALQADMTVAKRIQGDGIKQLRSESKTALKKPHKRLIK